MPADAIKFKVLTLRCKEPSAGKELSAASGEKALSQSKAFCEIKGSQ